MEHPVKIVLRKGDSIDSLENYIMIPEEHYVAVGDLSKEYQRYLTTIAAQLIILVSTGIWGAYHSQILLATVTGLCAFGLVVTTLSWLCRVLK